MNMMGEITSVATNKKGFASLRTTIPMSMVNCNWRHLLSEQLPVIPVASFEFLLSSLYLCLY